MRHWSEVLSCHACGKTFRSASAEARHRHNASVVCREVKRLARLAEKAKEAKPK